MPLRPLIVDFAALTVLDDGQVVPAYQALRLPAPSPSMRTCSHSDKQLATTAGPAAEGLCLPERSFDATMSAVVPTKGGRMPTVQAGQQRHATRPATTPAASASAGAAYVILSRNPLLWTSRGPEAALVSDGRRLLVLGQSGVVGTLRRHARYRWRRRDGDPVEQLTQFCAGLGMSLYERHAPVADPSPLRALAERLAEQFQWPLEEPPRS